MDLQIFQIPKMSFQTPRGWESAKARGLGLGRPRPRAGGLRIGWSDLGPLCGEGGRLLGPFPWSPAAAQASWLSPSCQTLPLLHSILKHESDRDSFCDNPAQKEPIESPDS